MENKNECKSCSNNDFKEDFEFFKTEVNNHLIKFREEFRQEIKKFLLWLIGIIVTLLLAIFGYILFLASVSSSHVTKNELEGYVTRDDFYISTNLHMRKMEQILMLSQAEANDSLIIDAFENWHWIVDQLYQTNPRGPIMDNKDEYSNIINNIQKNSKK